MAKEKLTYLKLLSSPTIAKNWIKQVSLQKIAKEQQKVFAICEPNRPIILHGTIEEFK